MRSLVYLSIFLAAVAVILGSPHFDGSPIQNGVSLTQELGQNYNLHHRNNVIRNHQSRIKQDTRCSVFRDRIHAAGTRHETAASGGFALDIMAVTDAAAQADCVRINSAGDSYGKSLLDRSILSWQRRVSDSPACSHF